LFRAYASPLRADKLLSFFIFTVNITASFADQDLLAFGAGDFHVRLVGAEVSFTAAGAEGPPAGFTNQKLFAKAAFNHPSQSSRKNGDWKGPALRLSTLKIACGLALKPQAMPERPEKRLSKWMRLRGSPSR
jgi:hypothetical protein